MKKFLKEIEDNICGLLLLAMMVLTCINVFARYVFKSSMPFVEELTALGLVIISLSGAAVAAKRGAHLGLTVLTDLLPEKVQKGCVLLGHLLGTVFGLVLLGFGISMAALEYELDLGDCRYAVAGVDDGSFCTRQRSRTDCTVHAIIYPRSKREGRRRADGRPNTVWSVFCSAFADVPIGLSLGISSILTLLYENLPVSMVTINMYSATSKFVLLAIPFFILGGNIMEKSGTSQRLD